MNTPHRFWMLTRVDDYLATRRALGFDLRIAGGQLRAFASHAQKIGHVGPLTIDLVVSWARSSPQLSSRGWARRLEIVRPFARYLTAFDAATEIPPPQLFGPAHRRLTPHIYSTREIGDMLRVAAAMAPIDGLRPVTIATAFGLLACTGLRVSEALHLTRTDVDLGGGVLRVRATKFRKSRLVPLAPSATRSLRRYVQRRDLADAPHPVAAFFVVDRGRPLTYRMMRTAFGSIRRQLAWKPRGGHRYPRVHDLRHTFACRRVLAWYSHGIDVDLQLPALSTYLGHASVSATYWYLSASPQLLAITARRFESYAHDTSETVPC